MFKFKRGWRWLIIASTLALGLAGCSALRLVYPQAGELVFWWLDGYVDFDDTQSPLARDALAQWFAWHRRTELPVYAEHLQRLGNEVGQDLTAARACEWFDRFRVRADAAVEHALPEATALAASFTPTQLRALERKQGKLNAEFKDDFLQADPAQRLAASVERAVERTEQLYGKLNEAQRRQITQRVAASPFDAERWFAERVRRQRELLGVLTRAQRPPASREAITADLRRAWKHTLSSADEAYARYQQSLEAYNCEFFAETHNRTTPEQRTEAQRRLRGWESDFRRLATPS